MIKIFSVISREGIERMFFSRRIRKLTDDILRKRNVGNETLAFVIDLKKVFDTVHHSNRDEKTG